MLLRLLPIPLACLVLALPARAQERQWALDASDQDAYLVFGVPDSDDIGLSLWCPIRKGMINVFVPETGDILPAGQNVSVTLKAGSTAAEIMAKTEVNADAGVSSIEGQIAADSPFFDALAKADRFHIVIGKEDIVFPLMEADVSGLLALCRK